jgi:hypothetical protein
MGSESKVIGYRHGPAGGEYVDVEVPIAPTGTFHASAARELCQGAMLQVRQPGAMVFGGTASSVAFAPESGEERRREQRGLLTIRTAAGRIEVGPVTLDATALAQLGVPVPPEAAPATLPKASISAAAFCAAQMVARLLGADVALESSGLGRVVRVRAADGRTFTSEPFEPTDNIRNLSIGE